MFVRVLCNLFFNIQGMLKVVAKDTIVAVVAEGNRYWYCDDGGDIVFPVKKEEEGKSFFYAS